MTLGVLPAYRGRNIGSKMVKYIEDQAKKIGAECVYLHVWVTNKDAISFYKKQDFEIGETLQGYYKRVNPPDAYIVKKVLKN